MSKSIRNLQGSNVQDPSTIAALEYNRAAGSQKVSEVGRNLLPLKYINTGAVAYTTDASTARVLDKGGVCLAVYNNSSSVGSVTLYSSGATPAVLASGVTDVNGNVGIPCMPNAWTYIACESKTQVISSAATLLVFVIDDETSMVQS